MAVAKSARNKPLLRTGGDLTDGAFGKRLASERIAADLDDFRSSGGAIEVLGITRVLKKLDEALPGEGESAADQPVQKQAGAKPAGAKPSRLGKPS